MSVSREWLVPVGEAITAGVTASPGSLAPADLWYSPGAEGWID